MSKYLLPLVCLSAALIPCQVAVSAPTSKAAIAKIARQSTVRIISSVDTYGSGVIIQKQGNIYTLLTAKHVVAKKGKIYPKLTAMAANGSPIVIKDVRLASKDVDLAIVKFTSNNNYPVAKLARNSDEIVEGMAVYVSGYPLGTNAKQAIYSFLAGKVAANSSQPVNAYGYSMVYSNETLPGQSGGPVWNDRGEVVAIHGMGDVDSRFLEESGSRQGRVKTGFNLGIGTNILLRQAKNLRLAGFPSAPIVRSTPIDDAIVNARVKYEQGDYAGAIRDYDRAIQLDSNRSEVYTLRGGTRLTGINRKLLTLVARELKTGNTDTGNIFDSTVYQRFRNEYNLVLADYEKSAQLEPQDLGAQFALAGSADIYNKLGEYPKALERIDRAIEFTSNSDTFYAQRAIIHSSIGNYDKSLLDWDRAIAIKPNFVEYRLQKYFIHNNRQQYSQAIAELDKAISIDPNRSYFFSTRATTKFFKLKDDPGAIADISAAISLAESGKASDDRNADRRYTTPKERLADYYISRSLFHSIKNRYVPALADLEKSSALDPNNYQTYFNRAFIYNRTDRQQLALADLDRALKLAPKSADVYNLQGNVYRKLKQYPQAITSFTKAIEIVKSKSELQNDLESYSIARAEIYNLDRQYELAIADYTQAIKLNPKVSNYYASRGNVYYNLKQYRSTITDLDRAIALTPNDPLSYIFQGSAYLEIERADLAIKPLQQSLTLIAKDPSNYSNLQANALANLGAAQYLTKNASATETLDRALKLDAELPKAWYYQGLIKADRGNLEGAIGDLERASKLYLEYKSTAKYQLVQAKLQQLRKK
ncbi:tetratricopeptide repeat protein [Chamaesiphon sp. VAR_48_metabat_403]|uniref:tetratricopeptide repeat protein n=1 Tax=Chamaesiphon sp. VAR_48_metabat_403 TaxID=2964700 RepID=UPI00286EA027|nr:tetratricopeptide repeat protein [Chamaesiphon sp. VAR_48_metabat_403]